MSDNLRMDAKVEGSADFRSSLLNINAELMDDDIEALKFLCRDFAPLGLLERVKKGTELFSLLEGASKLKEENKWVLAEMLKLIMRLDLVETLQVDETELNKHLAMHGSHLTGYKTLLLNLSNKIDKDTLNELCFAVNIPKSKKNKIHSALGLFIYLEEQNKISSDHVTFLEELFEQRKRSDLALIIRKYEEEKGVSTTSTVDQSPNIPQQQVNLANQEMQAEYPSQPTQPDRTTATVVPMNLQPTQSPPLKSEHQIPNVAQQSKSVDVDGDPVPYYTMDANPRGICLIINNRIFKTDSKTDERLGTDEDAIKLGTTFEKLKFTIKKEENLSREKMVKVVNQLASHDHRGYDCVVVCILSHGDKGVIYGCNGLPVRIRELTAPFRPESCPTLSGKPKLFFIQACQGKKKQPRVVVDQHTNSGIDSLEAETIPSEADFLLGYATVPDFVAFRLESEGTYYIIKLTEMLDKYAKKQDVLSLLTLVNYEVGKEDIEFKRRLFKQSPSHFSTLRKKVLFK